MVFKLSDFHWIGFDLDHTIIRYNVPALDDLVYHSCGKYLVNHRNYPAKLLSCYPSEMGFKGLVIDVISGDLLKLDHNKRVIRAYHGSQKLTDDQIQSEYPHPLSDFNGTHTKQHWTITTFFERSIGPLWTRIVDIVDQWKGRQSNYQVFHADIINSLQYNFADFSRGYYFSEIQNNPGKYLFKRENIVAWLKQVRAGSEQFRPIQLFLLTNSFASYTKLLCDYSLGEDWQSLFDINLFQGEKPVFWHSIDDKQYNRILFDPTEGSFTVSTDKVSNLETGNMYSLGNAKLLKEFFETTVPEGETLKVCYFGDHISSDCGACKKAMDWHTVAIVEEIEHISKVHTPIEEIHTDVHEIWGSYFADKDESSDELIPTFWCEAIRTSADLAVPCMSCFLEVPLDYEHKVEDNILSPCAVFHLSTPSTHYYYKDSKCR